MKRLALVVGAFAAALCLHGCFSSRAPLYAEETLNCPFAEETYFGAPLIDAGGDIAYRPAFSIRPDGHACVRMRDGSTEPERLALSPLGDGWYVVQQFKADSGRYYYGLVHIEGERVWSYEPGCGDFTPEALREFGVANPWAGVNFGDIEATAGPPPLNTPKRQPPAPVDAPVGADDDSGGGDMSCELTTAAQLEGLFRAWIRLGRPADDYGDLIPAPAPSTP
jgi:hypothetical protein